MNFLFASPSSDDFIHLLKAWKFWLLGAVGGALILVLAPWLWQLSAERTEQSLQRSREIEFGMRMMMQDFAEMVPRPVRDIPLLAQ